MKATEMRLCDAGIREQEWAQKLVDDKRLPPGVTYADMLAHAVYDASSDEVVMTVKAATLKFRVERP